MSEEAAPYLVTSIERPAAGPFGECIVEDCEAEAVEWVATLGGMMDGVPVWLPVCVEHDPETTDG